MFVAAHSDMTTTTIELTSELVLELELAVACLAEAGALATVPLFARAIAPALSQPTRAVITLALRSGTGRSLWTASYAEPEPVSEPNVPVVPGESTIEEVGESAFLESTIRSTIYLRGGELELGRWLAIVPDVHRSFAMLGAEKVVASLHSRECALDEDVLDAFASEMATWAHDNDPALQLSATALP
jgi:hypothetical protein